MSSYSTAFLKTQIGRSVAVHYDTPRWQANRRKSVVSHGFLVGVEDRYVVVQAHEEDHPTRVEIDANEPVWTTRDGVWWEFTSPQRPVPPDFVDE